MYMSWNNFVFLGKFGQLAVFRGKFTLDFLIGEWKIGRLREVSYGGILLKNP